MTVAISVRYHRSANWRGGTYLFGAPRHEHVSPPMKGLRPRPRYFLRVTTCETTKIETETCAQLRDQVEEALAAGRAHHGRVATADVRRQTEGTKRRRAGEVPGTHAMM